MESGNLTKFTQLGSHRAKATASLLTTCCQKLLRSAKLSSEKTLKVQNCLSYRHIRLLFISIHNLSTTHLPFCFAMTTLARASLVTHSGVWLIGTAFSLCDGPKWEPPPDACHTGNSIPVSVEMVLGGFRQRAKRGNTRVIVDITIYNWAVPRSHWKVKKILGFVCLMGCEKAQS